VAHLDEARRSEKAGDTWRARRSAMTARREAIEAQRMALVQREENRKLARKVVDEVDALLNELEDLHSERSRGAGREQLSRLTTTMKQARATGAALFLAFEQAALELARKDLSGAAKP
jgi:uncharacterized membrane protein YccC